MSGDATRPPSSAAAAGHGPAAGVTTRACTCHAQHEQRRIVLTGGPGAGKTAVLQLIQHYLCQHMRVLPEVASMLFGGGFPRGGSVAEQRAAQRAIFYVQRELERSVEADGSSAIVLCDRGTIDGTAYWPGDGTLWDDVGVRLEDELQRYDAVVHLRTPPATSGYNHDNPVRIESAAEAARVDAAILRAWEGHPRRHVIDSTAEFMEKAQRAVAVLRDELPACCREHFVGG